MPRMNRSRPLSAFVAIALFVLVPALPHVAGAAVTVPPIFGDHMVLQRGKPAPVWGTAEPGEEVTVSLGSLFAKATADDKGNWMARLPALPQSDQPLELKIVGSRPGKGGGAAEPLVITDVLVGDVWVCSGQSNMEWPVRASNNAEQEAASANYAKIRMFRFPHTVSVAPTREVKGEWKVASPETVPNFSAVGYFFGRAIHQSQNVPIGLIDNSWGGMPAESYTSREALAADPDFKPILDRKVSSAEGYEAKRAEYDRKVAEWSAANLPKDTGPADESWAAPDLPTSDWKAMELPRMWENSGLAIDGAVWFRKEVEVPQAMTGHDAVLSLGAIDDFDTTYVNGRRVGQTPYGDERAYSKQREYTVPADVLRPGRNVIAVRVFDWFGGGGLVGPADKMFLGTKGPAAIGPVSLAGEWVYNVEKSLVPPEKLPPRPQEPLGPNSPSAASNLWNGMVHPIVPYAITGVIWYQGESNAGRAVQYQKLFPAMITDWRKQWGQGDFPFLFVQLANFMARKSDPGESQWAELRDAQLQTTKTVPNTAMAVIIDVGEEKDIHPKNKQDVAKRLALAAEKLAYNKADVVYSGPMYKGMKIEGDKVRLSFDHVGGGLVARGDALKGFAVAGDDKKFVWAEAKLDGNDVIVSAPGVSEPKAVRYGWADNPEVTLYNTEGLPATPFRTDDWPLTTAANQ
jgi:sialate O-acetylesterase